MKHIFESNSSNKAQRNLRVAPQLTTTAFARKLGVVEQPRQRRQLRPDGDRKLLLSVPVLRKTRAGAGAAGAGRLRRKGQQHHSFTSVNQWIGDNLKKPTKIPFHRPMRNLTKTRRQALATKTDRSENIGHLSCPDRKLES